MVRPWIPRWLGSSVAWLLLMLVGIVIAVWVAVWNADAVSERQFDLSKWLLGALVIVWGWFMNAEFGRYRDTRLRDEERRALAAALAAELLLIRNQCGGRVTVLKRGDQQLGSFLPFDVYLANVGDIGRLGSDWAGSVAAAYAHFSILNGAVESAGPENLATPETARHFREACRRAENLRGALERLANGEDPDLVAADYDPRAPTDHC